MSDKKESLMSEMTKLKAMSRLMLQTWGESRSIHTLHAGGYMIVPTSTGAVIWIFREPPVLFLSTYQPRLSQKLEEWWVCGYINTHIDQRLGVKELNPRLPVLFATTFIHENHQFFEIIQKLRIGGSLASEAIEKFGNRRFFDF